MRKLALSLMAILTMVSIAFSADPSRFTYPKDSRSQITGSIDFVGCDVYRISSSSDAIMITSTTCTWQNKKTSSVIPAIVYGVIFGTSAVTANDYIVFRDTVAAGRDTTHQLLPKIYPNMDGSGNLVITFPVPIYFQYGISAAYGAAGTAADNDVTILYRKAKLGY